MRKYVWGIKLREREAEAEAEVRGQKKRRNSESDRNTERLPVCHQKLFFSVLSFRQVLAFISNCPAELLSADVSVYGRECVTVLVRVSLFCE